MIILQADNRTLTYNAKYSYLLTNYEAGVRTISVLNATDSAFAANAYLLLGNFGTENCEIVQIASLNSTTGEIVLSASTSFAHSESTRVTVLPYNTVRFFYTTTTTYSTATPLTSYIPIQPNDWFTTYQDETYSTGYGWYIFYNQTTAIASQNSNYIPYTGFDRDTVEDVLNDFFSLLSNKELRLVTRRDALSWLNEAYQIIRNKLNLTNVEFTSSAITALSIISGTNEYSLQSDFDHLISLVSGLSTTDPGAGGINKLDIPWIPIRQAYSYTGSEVRYYIRGTKIGFVPTPTASTTYHYIYNAKPSRLSLNTDQVVLPDNGAYALKEFMMYRAYMKFQNPNAGAFYKSFNDNMNQMIIASVKRDAGLSAFSIDGYANV